MLCADSDGDIPRLEIAVQRLPTSVGRENQKFRLRGVMECGLHSTPYRWPVDVRNGILWQEQEMPVIASDDLDSDVPAGLVQDIEEAEEAHFNGLFKAATVMCRRAVQLSLEPIVPSPTGRTLGPLLTGAKAMKSPPLTPRGFLLADGIHQLGDIGAHRVEVITARQAKGAIEGAVDVLNELAPLLASQSGTGSSAP